MNNAQANATQPKLGYTIPVRACVDVFRFTCATGIIIGELRNAAGYHLGVR
jgi:hypothetical protein